MKVTEVWNEILSIIAVKHEFQRITTDNVQIKILVPFWKYKFTCNSRTAYHLEETFNMSNLGIHIIVIYQRDMV